MDNQKQRVLDVLIKKGQTGAFTYEFFDLTPPIIRPAARIDELRKEGHLIKTVRIDEGNFKYVLIEKMRYEDMDIETLKHKQSVAEDWLRSHEGDERYQEALTRYETLCGVLQIKECVC